MLFDSDGLDFLRLRYLLLKVVEAHLLHGHLRSAVFLLNLPARGAEHLFRMGASAFRPTGVLPTVRILIRIVVSRNSDRGVEVGARGDFVHMMSFCSRSCCCWTSRAIRGRAHGNILLFFVPWGPIRSLTSLLEQHAAGDNLSVVWLVLNHGDLFGVRPAAGSEQIRQVGRVIAIAASDHQVLGVVFQPVDRYAVFMRSDSHSDDLLWSLNLRQILRGGL